MAYYLKQDPRSTAILRTSIARGNKTKNILPYSTPLIEECKIKIKQLRRDEIKFKNKLRSVCDDSTTYTILTEKLSNHISNLTRKLKDKLQQKQAILTAERIRHASTQDSPHDLHSTHTLTHADTRSPLTTSQSDGRDVEENVGKQIEN